MTLRLGDLVVQGELFNTRRYSVHGWLELEGSDRPLMFNLTGDCAADLVGRHIRFASRRRTAASASVEETEADGPDLAHIAWQQIGPTGTMTAARKVKVADCPPVELYRRIELGEPPPMRSVRCLYLEWFSQNGRVLIELPDPEIEFVAEQEGAMLQREGSETGESPQSAGEEAGDDSAPGLDVTSIRIGDDGEPEIRHDVEPAGLLDDEDEEDADDPYGLIPGELQRQLDSYAAQLDQSIGVDDEGDETLHELELMDDLLERGEGEPVGTLFEKPLKLPRPEQLDENQAERVLKVLLAELAVFGIALEVCEHFTPRDAYRLLVEEICQEERAFPELRNTQWVQHFMTSEFCPQCEAEFEREFEERERRRGRRGEEESPGGDEEMPF